MARRDIPSGFGSYSAVLDRIADYRPAGKWVQFQCLLPHKHKNGDAHWSGLAWIGERGELVARCQGCGAGWKDIVAEVGLPMTEWFPDKGQKFKNVPAGRATTTPRSEPVSELVATYAYRDEDGELLFEKLRYEPKTFKCRRPVPQSVRKAAEIPPNAEAWAWGVNDGPYGRAARGGSWDLHPLRDDHQLSVTLGPCRRVLYRLPELLAAHPDMPVFLVEGEKDVETLRSLGLVATCTWTGSSSVNAEWLAPLAGRRVVIVPDNDDVGRSHAMRQAGWLVCGGVRSLRVLWWGEHRFHTGPGMDLTDWLKGHNPAEARAAVVDVCKRFPEYKAA